MNKIFFITIPVLMGYIPLGMAFGILAASNHFSLMEIILSSVLIYAGAGQFVLVGLVSAKVGLIEIFIASFLLNFRHFFYTLALLEDLKKMSFFKHYIMFSLTDESFAIISSQKRNFKKLHFKQKEIQILKICFLNHLYWIIGSVLGFFLQQGISIDYSGIEFSLNALFIVLAYELYKQNPNIKILILAIGISLLALCFIDKSYMLVCSIAVALLLLFLGKKYV